MNKEDAKPSVSRPLTSKSEPLLIAIDWKKTLDKETPAVLLGSPFVQDGILAVRPQRPFGAKTNEKEKQKGACGEHAAVSPWDRASALRDPLYAPLMRTGFAFAHKYLLDSTRFSNERCMLTIAKLAYDLKNAKFQDDLKLNQCGLDLLFSSLLYRVAVEDDTDEVFAIQHDAKVASGSGTTDQVIEESLRKLARLDRKWEWCMHPLIQNLIDSPRHRKCRCGRFDHSILKLDTLSCALFRTITLTERVGPFFSVGLINTLAYTIQRHRDKEDDEAVNAIIFSVHISNVLIAPGMEEAFDRIYSALESVTRSPSRTAIQITRQVLRHHGPKVVHMLVDRFPVLVREAILSIEEGDGINERSSSLSTISRDAVSRSHELWESPWHFLRSIMNTVNWYLCGIDTLGSDDRDSQAYYSDLQTLTKIIWEWVVSRRVDCSFVFGHLPVLNGVVHSAAYGCFVSDRSRSIERIIADALRVYDYQSCLIAESLVESTRLPTSLANICYEYTMHIHRAMPKPTDDFVQEIHM